MSRPELLALAALVLASGCPSNEPMTPLAEEIGDEPIELLSTVNVADPRGEAQLLEGFYALEQRAWRWTAGKFAVLLAPPAPVEGQPTSLDLRFTIPSVVIDAVGPITLTARINGVEAGSERYEQAGDNLLFSAEAPEGALTDQPARVEFELDKAIQPSERDERELGVVALSVALK